jgi:hypothetical protein
MTEAKKPAAKPEKAEKPATLADLQKQLDDMKDTMRRNGWTVK